MMEEKRVVRALCYLYWSAYHAGHHDTVEGQYTDVAPADRFDYHREAVMECAQDDDMASLDDAIEQRDQRIAELEAELSAAVASEVRYTVFARLLHLHARRLSDAISHLPEGLEGHLESLDDPLSDLRDVVKQIDTYLSQRAALAAKGEK